MIYDVTHRTTFSYEQTVSVSQHVLHLAPRAHPRQRRIAWSLQTTPTPSARSEATDYFGNPVAYLALQRPHEQLVVEARSRIDVFERDQRLVLDAGPSWEAVSEALRAPDSAALEAAEFAFFSPHVGGSAEILDYAEESFPPGRPLLAGVMDLTGRIHEQFEYRGGVSDVATPAPDVLAMRKGVCQDFAHLELACLRSLGLPARYVSGYLLTRPPEGQPKLAGSDASHAWISVWSIDRGWVDFDPTNNVIPGVEHITLAWGRDYGDVSPINGFIVGGGVHRVAVAVDVVPAGSPPAL